MTQSEVVRAVLLLNDSDRIAAWAHAALKAAIEDGLKVVSVAHCLDTPPTRPNRKTLAYYCFAFASRGRLPSTRPTSIDDLVPADVPRVHFKAIHEGAWQRIPLNVSSEFVDADVMIKFGMTLLRTDDLPLKYGVMSYHSGDPERYRGRPAGFYELMHDELVQGSIVQRISDTLDGGDVLAKAYSRVVPHSYAQTLEGAYIAGVPLLAQAIRASRTSTLPSSPAAELGPNYRLPRAGTVLRQVGRLARRKVARAFYGAIREKRWQISRLPWTLDPEVHSVLPSSDLRPVEMPPGYVFAADPCADGASFYAELLNGKTGLGEIGVWRDASWSLGVLDTGAHASYPQVVTHSGVKYLFPEIATTSNPRLFPVAEDGLARGDGIPLKGLESARLVDATLAELDGRWFLFAGTPNDASFRLDLWHSDDVFGPYERHPASPICVDPRGARMAGPIVEISGRLYRFGQNCAENYGGSARIHRIDLMNSSDYSESISGSMRISEHWGPHTVNVTPSGLLLDYFSERTTPLAGVRRVRARRTARQSQRDEAT